MNTKNDLRKIAKGIRKSLDMEAISAKIVQNILALDIYSKATNVMLFYPLEHEVNLLGLLKDSDKKFYLPKMDGENLLVCPYSLKSEVAVSAFKTKEPVCEPINNTDILDIIFVPALMIDKNFNRLGYGGGFYDKFLSKQSSKATRIVAISGELVVDKMPAEDFDEKINIIVCENNIFVENLSN